MLRMHQREVMLDVTHLHNGERYMVDDTQSFSLALNKDKRFPFFLEEVVLIQQVPFFAGWVPLAIWNNTEKNIYKQVIWSRSEK